MTMQLAVRAIVLGLALLAGRTPPALAQRSADALLQQAVHEELVTGDLSRAIALYRDLIARHSANRPVAARALANLGRAYEKLGAAEARSAYQRLLRDYADQAEPVGYARTRLAALGGGGPGESARAGPIYAMVHPDLPPFRFRDHAQFDLSPGGDRIVLRLPPANGDSTYGAALAIADNNGVVLRTLVPSTREVGRASPRWSPDGRYIVYVERSFVGADTSYAELRIIPADGGTPRTLSDNQQYANFPSTGGLFWTPDGKGVTLVNRRQIVTIGLDGQVKRTVPFALPYLGQVTGYSPDGRWLALHLVEEGSEQQNEMDVWVMPAEGGRAIRVTHSAGFDGWPVWGADGRSIYFVSERSGSSNLWRAAIDPRSGLPQGDPVQVTSYNDAAILHPRPLAGGRRLAYALARETSVIHTAAGTGPLAPRPVVRGTDPQLSPDGRTLYYAGQGSEQPGIFALSLDEGTPRRLTGTRAGGPNFRSFSLSPDGGQIGYFSAVGGENVLYTVSTGGGSPREVTRFPSREHLVPAWSPDGTRLAYTHGNGLYLIPSTGGQAQRLAHLYSWDGWTVRWAPDGRHVAALGWTEPQTSNGIFVVPVDGEELRRLTPPGETGYKEGLEWHPDSRRLSYMYYGDDDRGDGSRLAYLDGRPTTLLVDQPYPVWDYVGVWHPGGGDYHFIASTRGTWNLYAHDEGAGNTRLIWPSGAANPGAGLPAFSRDGQVMAWEVRTTARQLWVIEDGR